MAASNFFGRLAKFFSKGNPTTKGSPTKSTRAEPTPQPAKKSSVEATTASSPGKAFGSMSGAGGAHTYSSGPKQSGMHKPAPGAWRDKPMTPGAFGPNGTARLDDKRNQFEKEDSPKGLWTESKTERLSDPFSERPSKAPNGRPSTHSIH